MNILTIFSLLASVIYFALGFYAWGREPRSRLTQVFFLQCLSLTIWAFSYAFVYQAPGKESLWFWYRMSSLGWCTIGGITLHFFLLLWGKEKLLKKPWVYILLYLPGLILVYQVWNGVVVTKDFTLGPLGWAEIPAPESFWYWFHISNLLVCVLIGIFLFRQRGKTSKLARERAQTRLVVGSAASVLALGFIINMVLPALHITFLPAVAPIILLLWVRVVWQSMVGYRLTAPSPYAAGREIIAHIKELLILMNLSGRIIQVNPQAEILLGYKEEELRGKALETIIQDSDLVSELFKSLKGDTLPLPDKEIDVKTKRGEIVSFLLSSSIIRDTFKDPIGLVLIGHDLRQTKALQKEITIRKKAEEELIQARDLLEDLVEERTQELAKANKDLEAEIKERRRSEEAFRRSEERYRSMLASIEDGYYEVDLAGNTTFCNDAQCRILGCSRNELIGLNNRQYMDKENAEKVYKTFNRVYLTGSPEKGFDWELIRKDGSKVYVETSVSLIRDLTLRKVGFRGILRDVTRQKQAEEALKAMSLLDDLTGLYNRRGFLTLAGRELKVAQRLKRRAYMLFADLDDLKAINDTFGHLAGDQALKTTALIIKGSFRESDILARIGGDEFVILATEGILESSPELLVGRLRENLKSHNETSRHPYQLSLSTGVVEFDPEQPVSIETLLSQADGLMYQEKQLKRNQMRVARVVKS
jgi:diguanylate cyclase (GGDEF)-like protein/PAS domain S-box-containing protein